MEGLGPYWDSKKPTVWPAAAEDPRERGVKRRIDTPERVFPPKRGATDRGVTREPAPLLLKRTVEHRGAPLIGLKRAATERDTERDTGKRRRATAPAPAPTPAPAPAPFDHILKVEKSTKTPHTFRFKLWRNLTSRERRLIAMEWRALPPEDPADDPAEDLSIVTLRGEDTEDDDAYALRAASWLRAEFAPSTAPPAVSVDDLADALGGVVVSRERPIRAMLIGIEELMERVSLPHATKAVLGEFSTRFDASLGDITALDERLLLFLHHIRGVSVTGKAAPVIKAALLRRAVAVRDALSDLRKKVVSEQRRATATRDAALADERAALMSAQLRSLHACRLERKRA